MLIVKAMWKLFMFWLLLPVTHVSEVNMLVSDFSPISSLTVQAVEDVVVAMEPINGTNNFRIRGQNRKDDKTWYDGREMKHIFCVRPGKCEKLKVNSCMGANVPYSHTSLELSDTYNQKEISETLHGFQALRYVPKCWSVIQPFLCAVFIPKCEVLNNKDMVFLPSLEMCRMTVEPCRIFYNTSFFPDFLRCNENIYPSKCNNDVREMKFNTSGSCLRPLVATDSSTNYYHDIDGCGVQCNDPLYSNDEHRQIHKLIAWGACVCLIFNLFAVSTFLIDWQNASKYPALVIFYVNFCFMMCCIGWLAQFTPGGRDDIICRKDGTLRHSEPSAGENLSCIVVFVLVYYFLIAAMVWFVIFTYAWHMSFRLIGKIQERIDKKGSYFHLVAWSLPLVLTITIMAFSEVDGNSVVGICFVGYLNHSMRVGLLLGPIVCVLLVGGYFLSRGMLTLVKLKISSKEIISTRASHKIRETIVRIGLCTLFMLVFILATIVCHINEFRSTEDWTNGLREFIICKIKSTYSDHFLPCKLESRPSVAVLQLHLLCLFASGIVMSSWVWTKSTLETWSRYFRRKFGCNVIEPAKLKQKHKLIAQAFAKRKEFQHQRRLSINFYNSRTDPVGLKFDLDSNASHEFSSTWANNLPRFVNRRCALTGAATSSSHGPRRNSIDSEISFSVRHVSVESRRNSVDSQVSVKIAEMKTKVAGHNRGRNAPGRHKNRSRRREFSATSGKKFLRRESTTSIESQIITSLQKGSCYSDQIGFYEPKNYKNMKRRSANAALDAAQISNLLTNGKLLLPFLQNQGLTTSDEENQSFTSFKVKDSRVDVILKQVIPRSFSGESHEDEEGAQKIESTIHNLEHDTTEDEKTNGCNIVATQNKSFEGSIFYLRGNKEKAECGRNSKNSLRSVRSGKGSTRHGVACRRQRHISRTIIKEKKGKEKLTINDNKDLDLDLSLTSFCSELSPIGIQSSYSGLSISKTNSRTSKRSCDVGIQANAYEIATQTMLSFEDEMRMIDQSLAKNRRTFCDYGTTKESKTDENQIYHENQQLLMVPKQKEQVVIFMQKETLSETEKLKQLLLPSK